MNFFKIYIKGIIYWVSIYCYGYYVVELFDIRYRWNYCGIKILL